MRWAGGVVGVRLGHTGGGSRGRVGVVGELKLGHLDGGVGGDSRC
jgi:hypothetical protein